MFEVYDVEAWRLFGGWVLFAIASLVGAIGWRMAYILNKSNGRANEGWQKSIALNKGLNDRANKAEANAREAEAGHRECARKLEETEGKLVRMTDNYETTRIIYGAIKAKYEPKRLKDGKFAPKSGKTGEKKKVSKQLDTRKQRK